MIAPFYHVGIIVPELGRAQRDLTASLGLSWASEQRRAMPVVIDGATVQRDISFVYSIDGPPHIELIGANEPPWNPRDGLHHMGIWSEDIVADMQALLDQDYTVAATGEGRGGSPVGFAYLNGPTGVLVELVETRSKPAFERWLAGGEFR
jgi:hypothetical protein